MRERGAPTPRELAVWLQVCSPLTARGTCLRTAGGDSGGTGWFAYGGPPAITTLPPGVPVDVAFAAPGSWRLDAADGPVARSDGRRSVVWKHGALEAGVALMVLGGPSELLQPVLHDREGGLVAPDELLGRDCWRWEHPDGVLWVDEQTGCLLRRQDRTGDLRWTAVVLDGPVDQGLFALPADLPEPPPSGLPERSRPVRQEREVPPAPGFSVPWWPLGCDSQPVGGDPDVPELLAVLLSAGPVTFWVGVAPAGRPAPVRSAERSRRWDGDGCSLSLSWQGEVPDDVVDRVVASVPGSW